MISGGYIYSPLLTLLILCSTRDRRVGCEEARTGCASPPSLGSSLRCFRGWKLFSRPAGFRRQSCRYSRDANTRIAVAYGQGSGGYTCVSASALRGVLTRSIRQPTYSSIPLSVGFWCAVTGYYPSITDGSIEVPRGSCVVKGEFGCLKILHITPFSSIWYLWWNGRYYTRNEGVVAVTYGGIELWSQK